MLRTTINTLLILFVIALQTTFAQQGSSPVGVNFILVNFNSPPTTLSVEQAPLKYNKDFALSMQIDDSDESIFTTGYPLFEGDQTTPGLYYSDGCGNNHSFKISSSTYVFSNNGTDIHNGYPSKITWSEMDTIYQHGWGIINHGVDTDASSDPLFIDYSIKRNKSYIRRKLYNASPGGVLTNIFVNPNGNENWTQPAFNQGYISALRQSGDFPSGNDGGDVNDPSMDWTQPFTFKRYSAESMNVTLLVDGMANLSINGANYWSGIFSHNLGTNYLGNFTTDFTNIANTYGINGLDNILMTTDEEILDYLIIRDATDINYVLNGNLLLITFSGEVPDNLRHYSSSIVINSDAIINNITVDGTDDVTHTDYGISNALINVNWDGQYIIPAETLADSMVTIAVATQSQYNCWIAMDYVITMTNGSHKDSLRQVLCNIPNVTYDDGFCNCEITLQQTTIEVIAGDCVTLLGPSGDYTYIWSITDSTVVDFNQNHITCPFDTLQFKLVATNPLGCPAEDSITVDIHVLNIDLGPDQELCRGECVTISGPENMTEYHWYKDGNLIGSNQDYTYCDNSSGELILQVKDSFGATASDSININVLLLPMATISPDNATIVLGDPIILHGPDGTYNYQWYYGNSLIGTNQTITLSPSDTTQYNLIVTDTNGCIGEDSTMVNVHSYSFNLDQDTSICSGSEVTIYGPPYMALYNWYTVNGTIGSDSSITVSPGASTKYFLQVTDTIGASAVDSVTITVLPLPIVTINPDNATIILGDPIVLQGPNGSYNYQWFLGDSLVGTTQSITQYPSDTVQYNLILTDINGCINEDSTMVNVHSYSFNLNQDTSICIGSEVTIYGPPFMAQYDWYTVNGTLGSDSSITVSPIALTKYFLEVTDTIGASAIDSVTVDVLPIPVDTIISNDTTIMLGACTPLLGPPGYSSYAWYEGNILYSTLQDTSTCPTDTTTYTLIITDQNGCQGIDSVKVSIELLVVDLGPDTTICVDNCVYIEGPPDMIMYVWYEDGAPYSSNQSIEPCPTITTQYSLFVMDQYGNSDTDTIQINVNPKPIVNLGPPDTTILLGDSIALYGAPGNNTWEWYKDNIWFSGLQDIVDWPNDTAQYKHIATNSFGCKSQDSIMVNVHSFTFDLGPDTAICEGSSDTLIGPPDMVTYWWYEADSLLPDDTTAVLVVWPTDITKYSLIAKDSLGYSFEDSITISVIPAPEVFILPVDSTINIGDTIDLYGPNSAIYVYEWYIGDSLLADTTYNIATSPDTSMLYNLIVTDTSTGCSAEDSTWVYVNFLSFDLGPDTTKCEDDCYTIIGPANMQFYEWWVADTSYATTKDIEACETIETQYTLWVEDFEGATAEDSITIFTKPSPTVLFDYDPYSSCAGDNVGLSVTASSDVEIFTWWYLADFETTTSNTYTLENVTISGSLNIVVTSQNECAAMDNSYINVYNYPSINVTKDTSVCLGDSIQLSISGGNHFLWIVAGDIISTESEIYVHPTETTDYIAQTAFDDSLCYSVDTVTVEVYDLALTKINYDYDSNYMCTYDTVLLTATGADNYLWIPRGDTTVTYSFQITDTTQVWLLGTMENGCSSFDSVTFYNKPVPNVSFTGLLPAFCINDSPVDLVGNPPGGEFSGLGHVGGQFDPGTAAIGINEIIYQYRVDTNSCYGRDTNTTIVYDNGGVIDLGENFSLGLTDSRTLNAGQGFDNYFWTTGETTQEITIYGEDKPTGTYEYAVMGVIGGCSSGGNVLVTFGADNYSENYIHDLIIYPNPNTGKFTVKFSTQEKDISMKVRDMHGNLVYKDESVSCDKNCISTINMEGIYPGIYFLQIITPKGISTTKVMLK